MADFPLSSLCALSFHLPAREALKDSTSPAGGCRAAAEKADSGGPEGRQGEDRGEGRAALRRRAVLLFPWPKHCCLGSRALPTQGSFLNNFQRAALGCFI